MIEFEKIFNEFNGQTLIKTQNFIAQLLQLSQEINCDIKVKKLFFHSRMYFRIRKLKQEIIELIKSRKKRIIT